MTAFITESILEYEECIFSIKLKKNYLTNWIATECLKLEFIFLIQKLLYLLLDINDFNLVLNQI